MIYPSETQALMARSDPMGIWWVKAIREYERMAAKRERAIKAGREPRVSSRWLPHAFDPFKVCPADGPTGLPCADPWCSEPGVVAPGHDRR